MSDFIYKLLSAELWQQAQLVGGFNGSSDDLRDGYIHFSDAAQVAATYQKYFSNQAEVWLLTVSKTELLNSLIRIIGDREASAALRYEASRGGALFAHLYAPLPLAAVLEARPYRANEVLD